jgi:hypothetical protein
LAGNVSTEITQSLQYRKKDITLQNIPNKSFKYAPSGPDALTRAA